MSTADDDLTADGQLAGDFLLRIGARIRMLRQEQGLTVQQLADQSQISRRLMTQIEHGQANPSLVAITRISRQLGTDFTTLLSDERPETPIEVVAQRDHVLVWSSEAGSTAYLLGATAAGRSADMWLWTLAPHDRYQGNADPTGSQELFYVVGGTLTLRADGVERSVPAKSSARLRSDRPYEYVNHTDRRLTFVRTVALAAVRGTAR